MLSPDRDASPSCANRASRQALCLVLLSLLLVPPSGAIKLEDSSTGTDTQIELSSSVRARDLPKLTSEWLWAPPFEEFGPGLRPRGLQCDLQLKLGSDFLVEARVRFIVRLFDGSKNVLTVRETIPTGSLGQAFVVVTLDEEMRDKTYTSAKVTATVKDSGQVDYARLRCDSDSSTR